MTKTSTLPCPACDQLNRLPDERDRKAAKCGRCGARLFAQEPMVLDESRFARHAAVEDLPLLVDFGASWCGPCHAMAPIFAAAAAILEPRVRLAKIDIDEQPHLAARFSVRSVPTLLLLRGGREVARHAGVMSQSHLQAWVESGLTAARGARPVP